MLGSWKGGYAQNSNRGFELEADDRSSVGKGHIHFTCEAFGFLQTHVKNLAFTAFINAHHSHSASETEENGLMLYIESLSLRSMTRRQAFVGGAKGEMHWILFTG